MDPDQTAPKGAVWSGFMVFSSMIESSLKCNKILQPHNEQVSKEVVHELEFGDIAVMQI